jgi:hypothetical protein
MGKMGEDASLLAVAWPHPSALIAATTLSLTAGGMRCTGGGGCSWTPVQIKTICIVDGSFRLRTGMKT